MSAKVRRMLAVESSMIRAVGFDCMTPGVEHGYLVVQFVNGEVYGYENVAWRDYLLFLNSPSIGKAFAVIKSQYKAEKISTSDVNHVKPSEIKPTPKEDAAPMLDVLSPEGEATKKRRTK